MPHVDIGGSVMGKLYMGFDAGTQSVKVAVYDEQFRLVTSRSLPTSLTYPQPGWVEMDVNTYLDNCVVCMAETTSELRRLGFDPKDVSAIMGDGIICGIVGIDENADPVTPYITSTAAPWLTLKRSTPKSWISGAVRPAIQRPPPCFPRCSPAGSSPTPKPFARRV